MIDNDASINLCKQSALHFDLLVNTRDSVPIIGITATVVPTLGFAILTILNKPHKFYVVSDEFAFDDDMILGRLILQSESAIISYYTNAIVMAGDVMNPIPFLTAEERAFHSNRRADLNEQYIHEYEQQLLNISQKCETASDNFSMISNSPSDYVKADIITTPAIETVDLQPPARCTQKVSSFDHVEKELPSTLRICCWNICGLRSNIQKGGFDYLLRESHDIIALQETKCPGDKRPEQARLPHYYVTFSDNVVSRGYSGVALYSKEALISAHRCRQPRA